MSKYNNATCLINIAGQVNQSLDLISNYIDLCFPINLHMIYHLA